MASDTPPFMPAYPAGPSTSQVDTPDNSLPASTVVDTPAPELSPAEAAAEASRIEAVAGEKNDEAAAAERAVQAAALEKVLSEGAGPDRMVTFTDSEGGTHTVSIDEFLAAQGYVPSEVVKSGYEPIVSVTNSLDGSQISAGKLVFTAQTGPVARTEIDNGTVTAFDRSGKISWQGNLVDLVASQVQGAPETSASQAASGPAALTQGREKTHGSYSEMAGVTMELVEAFQDTPNWDTLPCGVKVMFFNLAQKSARILTGDPLVADHYADISGYAYLAEQEVTSTHALHALDNLHALDDLPDGFDGTH